MNVEGESVAVSSSTSSSGSPRTNEWRKSLVCFYTDEDEDVAEEAAGAGTNVIDLTETTTMLSLATASSCDAVPTPPTPPTHDDAGADVWVAEWDGVQYSSSSSAAGEEAQPQQQVSLFSFSLYHMTEFSVSLMLLLNDYYYSSDGRRSGSD